MKYQFIKETKTKIRNKNNLGLNIVQQLTSCNRNTRKKNTIKLFSIRILPKKLELTSKVTIGRPNICFQLLCKKFNSVLKISIRRSRSDAMKNL